MPRYMFHVVGSDQTFIDDEGVELPSLDVATEEARKDARDLVRARFERISGDWTNWAIQVCDVDGNLLATVPFASRSG